MDISVSRLNKRMALQLPAEFPLGLVFVVGKVRNITHAEGEEGPPFFHIVENGYMIRCRLTARALAEIDLKEGDMIRAGGHLAFDTLQADYYLLARDVELLPEQRPSRTTLAPILADIKKRSQAASLAPAVLPDWVQQIAPPEIKEAAEKTEAEQADEEEETADPEPIPTAEPPPEIEEEPVEPALPGGFTDDLVDFLSEAMDSPDDVELTQEMVADLAPTIRSAQAQPRPAQPPEAAAVQQESRIPWAIVAVVLFLLLCFLSIILALALIAAP